MAKLVFLLGLLFVGGLAFPAANDDFLNSDEDMSFFFDHSDEDFEGFIIGGNVAAEGAHPWMTALTVGNPRSLMCGSSIVNNRRLLTAAHCIVPLVSGGIINASARATVGTNRWNRGGTSHQLSGHRIHPNYNANNIKNDIGILFTSTNIVMNNRVRALPLNWDFIGANVPCRVAGWGRNRQGASFTSQLHEINKPTVAGQHCVNEVLRVSRQMNMRVPAVDPNVELCTFLGVNRGTCHGDSGGPLVRNSNNAQVGIVSWGIPCAQGAPDIFTRLSAFRTWVLNNL